MRATVVGSVQTIEGQSTRPKAGAVLNFFNGETKYEARTGADGNYEISLPADAQYRVMVDGFGSCELSRAAFTLNRKAHVVLNFQGVACPFIDELQPNIPLDPESRPWPIYNSPCAGDGAPDWYWENWYKEQKIGSDTSNHRPEVMVAFGKCRNNVDITYYGLDPAALATGVAPADSARVLQVTVTAGTYTVRANQVVFREKTDVFLATGNVTVEDGSGNAQHGEHAILSFSNGLPRVIVGSSSTTVSSP